MFGDLNCNLDCPRGNRGHDISSAITLLNLSDVAAHFPHPRGRWTWSQWREGRYIRSVTDYILAQHPLEFSRWAIKTPRHNSDHRAIVVELGVNSRREHSKYCQRHEYPIHSVKPLCRIDQMFEDLCASCDLTTPQDHRDNSWISQDTWALIDKRASLARKHRSHHHADDEPVAKRTRSHDSDSFDARYRLLGICREDCQSRFRTLGQAIRKGLRRDRRERAAKVGLEAERLLSLNQVHEAFRTIQGWYRDRISCPSKPLRIDLHECSQQCASLYARQPIVGCNLLVLVDPYDISDDIPDAEEIALALHKLRKGRATGPSGVAVESLLHLETHSPEAWSLLVDLVQQSFLGHEIPLAHSYAILVLLPKNEMGKFRGITLLEVLHKLWGMIVYLRAVKVIKFHPAIHGFCCRRGCETAILEAKLEMQWAGFHSAPYFQIFLDLAKAFDSIDHDHLLDILAGCGFGPNILRFLRRNWNNASVVLRQMGYYGDPIKSDRGIWQGDILSPLFLNVIVDCILHLWHRQIRFDPVGIFYANDGRIAGFDYDGLQQSLDALLALFARVGLFPNVFKTKAMVSSGQRCPDHLSAAAFKRRYDAALPTYRARKRLKVQCSHCHRSMTDQCLPTHIRHVHHMSPPVRSDSSMPPVLPPAAKCQ